MNPGGRLGAYIVGNLGSFAVDDFLNISVYHQIFRWFILAIVLCVFAAAAHKVYWLLRYVSLGKGDLKMDELGQRMQGFLTFVIGQRRVIMEPAGIVHLFIFWGFLVLQVETIEYLIRAAVPWGTQLTDVGSFSPEGGFHFHSIFGDTVYHLLLLSQDVFGLIVLFAICVAAWRRFVVRPAHVVVSADAAIILGLIAGLMITKFFANGAELILAAPFGLAHDASWTPVASFLSTHLMAGSEPVTLFYLHHGMYWCHLAIVAFFAWYIPGGKHLHLIGAMPNIFFRKLEPSGALYPLDMEDEEAESFGAGKLEELHWKQLLDTYACTECGRCEHYCPAYNTGKALNPMQIVHKLKDHIHEKGKVVLQAGDTDQEWDPLAGGIITKEELLACTTCGACVANCPVFIEHVDTIVDMRRHLALMEADFSPEVSRTFRNMENNSNPWGISSSYRADWTEGLEIPLLSEVSAPPDYLFWVGCAGSFDDRQKKVTSAFAKILKAAGISFAILGSEEGCTGDPARRIGNEYLYWTLATGNIETLNRYNVRKIITTCPHCFHTIKKEYPQLGGNYEVLHHTELIRDLIDTHRLTLRPAAKRRVVYHDSCYIGRWNDEYDNPRKILSAIDGLDLHEMELNRRQSFCCGAGGGLMWMEEHEGKRINVERTDQALAKEPEEIAVACPFCLTMFDDGLKARDSENVRLRDLAEIVAEQLVEETSDDQIAAAE
jgi:Fe-S oxidoreductase